MQQPAQALIHPWPLLAVGLQIDLLGHQTHDHAEFGDVKDSLRIVEQLKGVRSNQNARRQIAQHGAKADQRIELLLTQDEMDAVEALASERKMKRGAWIVSLVRRRLHRDPQPPAPEAKLLEGIRSELRRIGVNVNQVAAAAHSGAGGMFDRDQLSSLQDELRSLIGAGGAARRGDLSYWETPE